MHNLSRVSFALLIMLAACSLKPAQTGGTLKILLAPQQEPGPESRVIDLSESLLSLPVPTSPPLKVTDFGCFVVNVTGSGISSNFRHSTECQSPNNVEGRGFGVVLDKAVTYGTPIDLTIPSGPERYIDVYGLYPASGITECNASATSDPSTTVHATSNIWAYHLGRVITDLFEGASVTIPLTFASGKGPTLTCDTDEVDLVPGLNGNLIFRYPSACSSIDNGTPTNPPSNAGLSVVTDYSKLASTDNSSELIHCMALGANTSQPKAEIVLMSWNLKGFDLASYTKLLFRWRGVSGFQTFHSACDLVGAATFTQTGGKLEVWNNHDSKWEDYGQKTDAELSHPAEDYARIDASTGEPRVWIRLLGAVDDVVTPYMCSALSVDSVRLELHRAQDR